MSTPVVVGAISRQLLATLATGPKTLGEIAAALYGANDYQNRFTARQVIDHLRSKGIAINREVKYMHRRGQYQQGCPRLNQVYELVQQGKTVYELAAAIGGTDRKTIRQAQNFVAKLRKHGVRVDVEARYILNEKGNTP